MRIHNFNLMNREELIKICLEMKQEILRLKEILKQINLLTYNISKTGNFKISTQLNQTGGV